LSARWFWYPCPDDFHDSPAYGTGNCWSFSHFFCKQPEGIHPKHQLQKRDESFATWMEKAVTSGPAKAFWQHMEHEQIEKIFSGNRSGSVLPGFGMEIPESDHTVFALQDVLFSDDAPVQISAKINDCLVAVADILAVNNPFFRTVSRHSQATVNNGLQKFCPEDYCQSLVVEEIAGGFHSPQSCFPVDACPWHDNMNVRMIVKGS